MTGQINDMGQRSGVEPAVTVLITNWNGCSILRDALRSLYEMSRRTSFEVVLVDDASSDDSVAMVHREFPAVRVLVNPSNVGFVRANNRGVREARGRYVFLLNSDTVLVNDAVAILAAYLDSHPETGVCGGWLLDPDGSPQVSFGSFPSLGQAIVDALFLNDLFPRAHLPQRGRIPGDADATPRPVDYISGADLMLRRTLIERLGLFDERFSAYCEDVDLCHRVRHVAGLRAMFVPEARIIHIGGASYGRNSAKQVRTQYASYHLFLMKHYGPVISLATRFLYAWHYGVKLAVRLLAYVVASSRMRTERWARVRHAWYVIRYSLFPTLAE